MKTFVIVLATLILLTGVASAAPFLVCTPDPVVTAYMIRVDGAAAIAVPAPLHWDLGPIAEGRHSLEVAATNQWGISIYVPFDFDKTVPGTPSGIGLSQE